MNPVLSGLLGVLVGALLGHWFALGRDKRKEYNDRVEIIRKMLLIEKNNLKNGDVGSNVVKDDDVLNLQVLLSERSASKLSKVHSDYISAYENAGDYNDDGMYEFNPGAKRNLERVIDLYLKHAKIK
ncbi:hypothetical protein [Photobacterium sanguinicancri]|uniref:hypothetical protein n=1 Tax=Photobacterium sanguinicancri TaxID=875932 RepID=UPI0021C32256|nr:hypothetical protein [Photobacterium sanguinicancri]